LFATHNLFYFSIIISHYLSFLFDVYAHLSTTYSQPDPGVYLAATFLYTYAGSASVVNGTGYLTVRGILDNSLDLVVDVYHMFL
jgi:hypothetical protein